MTRTWVLTGLTVLLVGLLTRAWPRLASRLMARPRAARAGAAIALGLFLFLLWPWNPLETPAALFAALFLALTVAAVVVDPLFFFAAYVSLMLFRPWELGPQDMMLMQLPRLGAVGVLTLTGLRALTRPRRPFLKENALLIAFFAWALVTCLRAPLPSSAVTQAVAILAPAFCFFFLIQFWLRDLESYRLLADLIGVSLLVVALLSLYWYSPSEDSRLESQGLFANSNDLAALCVMALPFVLRPALNRTSSVALKAVALLMAVPLLTAVYLAQSRGAWLGVGAVATGAWLVQVRKLRFGALVAAAVLVIPLSFLASHREAEDLQQSTESRIAYWKAGLNMALRQPILGVGFGRYPEEFENYSSGHQYEFGARTAHSSWILALAETGWLGFLLFGSLYGLALKETWRLRRIAPEMFLSLLGYGVAMTFLSHTFLFYPYLLLGLAYGLVRWHRETEAA